ncbi:MAG TPA: DUF4384 domain-containing protein [Blastocatellia bacterium]|nr:DUF4384 domain-containing protein [Blastocatellia bacterium]
MKSRLFKYSLIATIVGSFVIQAAINSAASVDGDPSFWPKPEKHDVPPPKPGRVRTEARKKRINKGEETTPLLAIKYEVFKRGDGNTMLSADPAQEFAIGDQVKLAITPNEDGFLYVIHKSVDVNGNVVDKPHVIFPDPRIENGQNQVQKNQKYVVPGYCQDFADPSDCWWEITPPNGKEFFKVIFSRDKITDLPNRLTVDDIESSGGRIDDLVITNLEKSSNQKLAQTDKTNSAGVVTGNVIYVRNTNRKDNEELIYTIELKHMTGNDSDPAARARALVVKKRADGMRIKVLKDGEEVDPSREFHSGDEIKVQFQNNFKGYVYIVNVTPGGKKQLLFPCSREMANEVSPGKWYVLPADPYTMSFDEEKGTEVLQVITSRERIGFLDEAIKECCDPSKSCEVGETASSAAAELIGKAGGIVTNVTPIAPAKGDSGIRARSIALKPGRDKDKEGSVVAAQDNNGNALVFEVRLKHN